MKELYTTHELAQKLKVHENTIINLRKDGMPFKRIGTAIRFDPDEVVKWLEEQNKEEVK